MERLQKNAETNPVLREDGYPTQGVPIDERRCQQTSRAKGPVKLLEEGEDG